MSRRRVALLLLSLAAAFVATAAPVTAASPSADPDPRPTFGGDRADAQGTNDTSPPPPAAPLPGPAHPYAPPLAAAPPSPAMPGTGAEALLRGPDLRGDDAPTLLERYGARGHTLDSQLGFGADTERALNAAAAVLFAIAVWLAQAVIAIVQWSFAIELFDVGGDVVGSIVGALDAALYTPLVHVAVGLSAAYAIWHGLLRHRGTQAAQGLAWTVFALAAGALFLASPGAILSGGNHVSTGVSRTLLAGVSVADPRMQEPGHHEGGATFIGDPADDELRLAGDRFWRVFVHQPWLVLQFGDPDAGRLYGERLLATKTISVDEVAEAAADPTVLAAVAEEKIAAQTRLREEILADPRVADWFAGRRGVERVGVASLAAAGVLVGGVLLALLAGALLLTQLGFLLFVLVAPLALLAGVHPGVGRVLALRWAALTAGLLLKRVALGAVLAVVLVVNGVLLEAAAGLGWLVVVGSQTLLVAAAIMHRSAFARALAPTTLPVLPVTREMVRWSRDAVPARVPAPQRPQVLTLRSRTAGVQVPAGGQARGNGHAAVPEAARDGIQRRAPMRPLLDWRRWARVRVDGEEESGRPATQDDEPGGLGEQAPSEVEASTGEGPLERAAR